MENFQQRDMYDFIDDGVNKSIYTILNEYHPFLKNDFSLANLVNHMPDVEYINSSKDVYSKNYQGIVSNFSKLLLEKTKTGKLFEDKGEDASKEELNRIFEELKASCEGISDCKFFSTIREYVEYAQKTIEDPETKPLRDAVVKNAVVFLSPEDEYKHRERLIGMIYFAQAENRVKSMSPMRREKGQFPEWDRMTVIKKILSKKNGLREYDEFYDEASREIKKAALAAMQKARISTTCKMKRAMGVRKALKPTKDRYSKSEESRTEELFEKLKRMPKKEENSWTFESLKKPELLCDLQADYSEEGLENQRVVAFRYGRFKYGKSQSAEGGFNIDNTDIMPELVGISRIGRDGTKTYFVLMPPIDRIKYRLASDKTVDPGDRLLKFTITQDVEVPTTSGRKKVQRETVPTDVVDGKTGKKVNVFRNKEIPEELEEFFAKVYFSDEYLSSVIENNARYLGSVVDGEDGPVIVTADEEKLDLAAAHYAVYFPGKVDRLTVRNFESYCSSTELDIRQFNLISEREKKLRTKQKPVRPKKDDGQGLDD